MAHGPRSKVGAPIFKTDLSEGNILYWRKVLVIFLGQFDTPIVIRRLGNCAPLVTPLSVPDKQQNKSIDLQNDSAAKDLFR